MKATVNSTPLPSFDQAAANALTDCAEIAVDAMRESFREQKTGRVYPRRGGFHRASRERESPAEDSGNLGNSFAIRRGGADSVVIENTASYAARLEDALDRPITAAVEAEAVLDQMEDAVLDRIVNAWR